MLVDNKVLSILKAIQSDIKDVKTRQDEMYQIVNALAHSAEVNRAEHDKMSNDFAHI